MKAMKIRIIDIDHFIKVQEAAFDAGVRWKLGSTTIRKHSCDSWIFIYSDYTMTAHPSVVYGRGHKNTLSTLDDLKTMSKKDKSKAGSVGAKYDDGKPRMDLLPFDALTEVAKVLTFGAEKYADNSWQNVPEGKKRYAAAGLRHFAADQSGEDFDDESGLLHKAHEACNALFQLHFKLEEMKGKESK